jgi:thiamine-monophosphate kinase
MSEFELIESFTRLFRVERPPVGPGDDCAVVHSSGPTCVSVDSVVEGVHFTRRTSRFEHIGHKALAVAASDLAAMGAAADWFVVALTLPTDVGDRDVVALGRGMAKLAAVHGFRLVGGNITRGVQLAVTVTVGGPAPKQPLVRSGAKAGERIYVSGPVGDAAAGLEVLRRGASSNQLKNAQRMPNPHLTMARFLRPWATSCIDVSDGLAQDVGHLAAGSSVKMTLWRERLPLSQALVGWAGSLADAQELGLRGGEDYVLAFTVPAQRAPAFERAVAQTGLFAAHIGEVSKGKGVFVDDKPFAMPGFRHR